MSELTPYTGRAPQADAVRAIKLDTSLVHNLTHVVIYAKGDRLGFGLGRSDQFFSTTPIVSCVALESLRYRQEGQILVFFGQDRPLVTVHRLDLKPFSVPVAKAAYSPYVAVALTAIVALAVLAVTHRHHFASGSWATAR